MVTNITSFSRSGLSDWLTQRVSSLILTAYFLTILGFLFIHPNLQFEDWRALFQHQWMRFFSLFFLLSLLSHTWIGLWTVLTDYVKCTQLRVTIQIAIILLLTLCLVWGIQILWGM